MFRFANFLRVFVLLGLLVVGAANQQLAFQRQPFRLAPQTLKGKIMYQDSVATLNKQVTSFMKHLMSPKQARQL
jgi:hypothetical protein